MKTNEVPTPIPAGSTNEPVSDHEQIIDEAVVESTVAHGAHDLRDEHDGRDARPGDDPAADPTGQLLLLPELVAASDSLPDSNEHTRFRLSKQTRERGLRHVAEIRAQLAAARERTARSNVVSLPPRRKPAA